MRHGRQDAAQEHVDPRVVGAFADRVGVFEGRDEEAGRPVRVRFTWSNITPTSARWEQET